jgi:hypothetical protein
VFPVKKRVSAKKIKHNVPCRICTIDCSKIDPVVRRPAQRVAAADYIAQHPDTVAVGSEEHNVPCLKSVC